MTEFQAFPKMPRISREVIITEKIDGTNAQIFIGEDGEFLTGSRTRWITPKEDNFGFSAWAHENMEELLKLGPGRHYGEWWGKGIQRNYSMKERVFSLFNVSRWADDAVRPVCCRIVPILYQGHFEIHGVMIGMNRALKLLETEGSQAAPGFMKPEGIVVFHTAGRFGMKKTFENDDVGKGSAQ